MLKFKTMLFTFMGGQNQNARGEQLRSHAALVNLALAFVLIFGSAFSCGQNNKSRTGSANSRQDQDDPTTRNDTERPSQTTGSLSGLVGTWLVISQTTKGKTEEPSSVIMGYIVFASDGTWNYGHNGGSAEGGTYEVSGGRLVMTGDDGTTWDDFRVSSRTSRDLFLESSNQVMHLRYKD